MTNCVDCGSNFDHYMVTDEVWAAAGLHWAAYCCLPCLERRLKRPLTVDDFTLCEVNRQAYAAAGKLPALMEKLQRDKQHEEQLRIFLGGKRSRWIDPASAIVSRSGTVHGVVSHSPSGRLTMLCGFTQYADEGPFEPVRDCAFCREQLEEGEKG